MRRTCRHIIRCTPAWLLTGMVIMLAGCDSPMDLSTLPQPSQSLLDTSYVAIMPPYGGFDGPEGLVLGKDQLLYVADTRANRVVMLNRAGSVLSERRVLRPVSVAQDTRLDLLVGGVYVETNGDTVGALFRIRLVSTSPDSAHRLDLAPIDTIWRERAHPQRRFPGIAVLADNSVLAVRDGRDNASFIDPDARVLQFDKNDNFITPMPAFVTGTGTGIANINHPTSIAAFPNSNDFILVQSSEGVAYGALWMVYSSTSDFQGWLPRFDPARMEDQSADFIRANRFTYAKAVVVDPARRDVFIADAEQDSIVKFNSRGIMRGESFGRVRSEGLMRRPSGLAYFDKILYVLDQEQGLLLRYRLSTDVPR